MLEILYTLICGYNLGNVCDALLLVGCLSIVWNEELVKGRGEAHIDPVELALNSLVLNCF